MYKNKLIYFLIRLVLLVGKKVYWICIYKNKLISFDSLTSTSQKKKYT